jgi:hypothetical protein
VAEGKDRNVDAKLVADLAEHGALPTYRLSRASETVRGYRSPFRPS